MARKETFAQGNTKPKKKKKQVQDTKTEHKLDQFQVSPKHMYKRLKQNTPKFKQYAISAKP